jgi:aryl-alcohol dehydrogenase-like predicted oxidoreductase
MEMRRMGRTGLKVSAICFGGNVFGWTVDEAKSFEILDCFLELGGNFIDTADAYSTWVPGHVGGESEVVIGNWLKERKNRDDVIIATKVASRMGQRPNDAGLSRRHIIDGVDASLRRLQTDYIDLYQAHWDDKETPLEETMRAFDDLVKSGKVRYIGASNYSAWRLTKALWTSDKYNLNRFECLQPVYNLVKRDEYERELEPLCLSEGVGVITYSSLASGFLSGKYGKNKEKPGTPRAQAVERRYMHAKGFEVLEAVEKVAEQYSATPSQVAIAWILARPSITAPIASTTGIEQTKELIGSLDLKLSAETIAELDKASMWS